VTAWATGALLLLGAIFALLAAVGIVRMPDVFTRLHASTKSATLGAGLSVLAVAVHFGRLEVAFLALLVVAFLFLTAPVASHMIGRAAYMAGARLWEGTVLDELRGHYDLRTHELAGRPEEAPAAESDGEAGRSGSGPDPGPAIAGDASRER